MSDSFLAGSLRRRLASSAGLRSPSAPLARQHLTQRRLRLIGTEVGRTEPADLVGRPRSSGSA